MTSSLARPRRVVSALWAAAAAVASGRVIRDYRRDVAAAQARLDAVPRMTVETRHGVVEYAESGAGAPLLVSHGIFHGCDGGLISVRDTVIGRRVISPSRFGYLGSTLPDGATAADQADAFVALLDHIGVDQTDVIGFSAGTTAALQMALRHPGRVNHLIVVSGNLPGDPNAVAPPGWARMLYNDLAMWTMKRFAHPQAARLMGIPAGFPRDEAQTRFVDEMLDSIRPMAPRFAGGVFDAYVSNPSVNDFPLESLSVPTLLMHSKDDPLCAFSAATQAATRIPGCRFVALESGGHLGLGQTERTRTEIEAFLNVPVAA
jgi:pimeloyl-ACP methyl ester carboxylesterase